MNDIIYKTFRIEQKDSDYRDKWWPSYCYEVTWNWLKANFDLLTEAIAYIDLISNNK